MISLLFNLSVLALPAQPVQSALVAVQAAKVYMPDGTVLDDGILLVEGSKIRAVGRGVEIPPGTPLVEHDGALTAGLVACHSFSGVLEESSDPTRAFLPQARMSLNFAPDHSDFAKALEAGITTLVLAPQTDNVAGGITAVVKSAGGRVLAPEAQLALSLDSSASRINRKPTSPGGALADLEAHLSEPEGVFALVAAGRMPVLIAADSRTEILRAAQFAGEHELRGALLGAPLAGELAEAIRAAELAVVFSPIGMGAERRRMQSVIALAKSSIPFGFALEAPLAHPETLRLSAALCVREGLDRAVALRALTADAARISGVDADVGALERGRDADFVLWSGDPLDLSSRVVSVWVDGVQRFGGVR